MARYQIGIDIGGTFTDIVLLDRDGRLLSKKVLSTPDDYSRGIEEGVVALLGEHGIAADNITELAHGTTIATNTIIERRGGKVALVTTRGFRDVLELGRFRAPRLYDLRFRKPDPLVERRLRFEVPERTDAEGNVLQPVDLATLDAIAERLLAEDVAAVAICFINAYMNPRNEQTAARHLPQRLPGISISTSSQLLPQIQEYERTSTTVINAYIRPVVEHYVRSLERRMERIGVGVPLMIMQSSGGVLPAAAVAGNPVYIIESGPAAGVVGAQRLARLLDLGDLMVLDMGGTTAKAALIVDGAFNVLPEGEVGGGAVLGTRLVQGAGYAVQVPTIDIAEVGAGGGSIATVDEASGVQVGPRSAGAVPGPVCYDLGGVQPTVTDANVILGYLNPSALVGGDLRVNVGKARQAIDEMAGRLGQPAVETAFGIHMLANANMMRAMRGVSIERGRDPARFALLAIGGNGPVHACGLAEAFDMERIVVPPVAGLFSALGLLFADVEHQLIRAFYRRLDATRVDELNALLAPLIEEAHALLAAEGFAKAKRQIEIHAEMKYFGQGATLSVPLSDFPVTAKGLTVVAAAYDELYLDTFGHLSEGEPHQFVTLRVIGRGLADGARIPDRVWRADERMAPRTGRQAYFGFREGWLTTAVMPRESLAERPREGPAIIEEYDATTVVRPGWQARLDEWNNIVMTRVRRGRSRARKSMS